MEEKVDAIIKLAGNENRFQYMIEIFIILFWINCNLLTISLPYLEKTSLVKYYDEKEEKIIEKSINYDFCDIKDKIKYEIKKIYDYSWVIEQNIECKSIKIGLIGTFAFTGNMIGALIYPKITNLIGKKKTLLIGTNLIIIFLIHFKYYDFF